MFLPLHVLQPKFTFFFFFPVEMSSVFHKHERCSSLVLVMKLQILAALESILLLCVVPIFTFHNLRYLQNQAVSLIHTQLEIKLFFWDTFQTGLHICMRLNITATAVWLKPNVKSYLRRTTQKHTTRQRTQPAASPCTHLISLSVLSRRLQFPKGSCNPACNLLICLLMNRSHSLPSQQSEVTICISHSDRTTPFTNLIQSSFIFHKLLCCKIQINSSYNYSEASPWHFYLSKRFFFYLAHTVETRQFCTMGWRKKVWWW